MRSLQLGGRREAGMFFDDSEVLGIKFLQSYNAVSLMRAVRL